MPHVRSGRKFDAHRRGQLGGARWHTIVPPSGPARSGTRAAAILVQPQAMHTRFQPSWVLVRTLDRAVTGVKRIASDREPCDARHDDDDSAAPLCTQGPGRGGAPASTPAATMSFRGALR